MPFNWFALSNGPIVPSEQKRRDGTEELIQMFRIMNTYIGSDRVHGTLPPAHPPTETVVSSSRSRVLDHIRSGHPINDSFCQDEKDWIQCFKDNLNKSREIRQAVQTIAHPTCPTCGSSPEQIYWPHRDEYGLVMMSESIEAYIHTFGYVILPCGGSIQHFWWPSDSKTYSEAEAIESGWLQKNKGGNAEKKWIRVASKERFWGKDIH